MPEKLFALLTALRQDSPLLLSERNQNEKSSDRSADEGVGYFYD